MWDIARTTLEAFALFDVVCQIVAAVLASFFDVALDLENFFPCSVAERGNAGVDDLGGYISSGSERVSVVKALRVDSGPGHAKRRAIVC